MSKNTKRHLEREWSDSRAEYMYKLVVVDSISDEVVTVVGGDIHWAIRQADHYKIEVPEGK